MQIWNFSINGLYEHTVFHNAESSSYLKLTDFSKLFFLRFRDDLVKLAGI